MFMAIDTGRADAVARGGGGVGGGCEMGGGGMNTYSARIRPFLRSLFGLSPMNYDMSVFMAPQVRPEVRHRYAQIDTPLPAPSSVTCMMLSLLFLYRFCVILDPLRQLYLHA